ncbi:hypothetical protein COO60DRAFT_235666 [Scenedesmus sp. NREL 46B-D3]|nr:hypothetical protein COO60DRAFT_235666 [Scenedesmus sp. NREL 46B-D3]
MQQQQQQQQPVYTMQQQQQQQQRQQRQLVSVPPRPPPQQLGAASSMCRLSAPPPPQQQQQPAGHSGLHSSGGCMAVPAAATYQPGPCTALLRDHPIEAGDPPTFSAWQPAQPSHAPAASSIAAPAALAGGLHAPAAAAAVPSGADAIGSMGSRQGLEPKHQAAAGLGMFGGMSSGSKGQQLTMPAAAAGMHWSPVSLPPCSPLPQRGCVSCSSWRRQHH